MDVPVDRPKIEELYDTETIVRERRNRAGEWELVEIKLKKKRFSALSGMDRLIHWFIDNLVFTFFAFIVLLISQALNIDELNLLVHLAYFGLYICGEYYFQQTPGKRMTQSIVVDEFGERPTFKAVIIRTLVRLIPLDAFSMMISQDGKLWHDKWSHTLVVSKTELCLIKIHYEALKQEKVTSAFS